MARELSAQYTEMSRTGDLPYGMWVLEDGGLVLFNRRYCPIWIRKGRSWERVENYWVKNIADKIWFYNDSSFNINPKDGSRRTQFERDAMLNEAGGPAVTP